jgi:hypothetical protein
MSERARQWPTWGPSEDPPPCPLCSSRETSFCGEAPDGPVYLCSPCCEAFFHEPAPPAEASGCLWGVAWLCLCVLAAILALSLLASPSPGLGGPAGQHRRW